MNLYSSLNLNGFGPVRSCHQAIIKFNSIIEHKKINYIVEADIKGFFDNVRHEWMMKFLEHDIADRKFLEIIDKFLK